MTVAVVSQDGYIKSVKVKIQPFDRLDKGDYILQYEPPPHDPQLELAIPVEPVTTGSIQFELKPHPQYEQNLKLQKQKVIQDYMDRCAQDRGYDSILQAVSYATDPSSPFYQEALIYSQWRSQCWVTGYAIINQVSSGAISIPQDTELIQMLPTLALTV